MKFRSTILALLMCARAYWGVAAARTRKGNGERPMKYGISVLMVACTTAAILAGCTTTKETDAFGVDPLVKNDGFKIIDLAEVLSAGEFSMKEPSDSDEDGNQNKNKNKNDNAGKLEMAFARFARAIDSEKNAGKSKLHRNRVQEFILAASNQACGVYKHNLKEFEAEVNFWLGSLTTALAGAGAIFTGTDIVRALSGAAGITSGVRFEFNEDFFQNLTIQVITKGLESKRREIYDEIVKNREHGLEKYPIQRAIKDAIFYHDHCSLISGLEQAAITIERNENPGPEAMKRFLKNLGVTRSAMDVLVGKQVAGVTAVSRDLPEHYASLDGSSQTRKTLRDSVDKALKITSGVEADEVAQDAHKNWLGFADAAFSKFDAVYGEKLKDTVGVAEKVHELTAAIEDKKTTEDERRIKTAELAVEQAKLRALSNDVKGAERTLASAVDIALKGFANAITLVRAKVDAKVAADKAGSAADIAKKALTAAETAKKIAQKKLDEANESGDEAAIAKAKAELDEAAKVLKKAQTESIAASAAAKEAQEKAKKAKEEAEKAVNPPATPPDGGDEKKISAVEIPAVSSTKTKDADSMPAPPIGAPVLLIEPQPLNN
jgi:hypothetical protein